MVARNVKGALMRTILFAASILTASTATAQDTEVTNGTSFGDWEVACDAVSTQRVTCRLVQSQSIAETGEMVLRLIVFPQDQEGALMVAQMPMGVYFPGGAIFRAADDSDAPVTSMVWQRCGGGLCEAALSMDATAVDAFVAQGAILFAYQMDPGTDRLVTRVDVSTLATGLAAIRP